MRFEELFAWQNVIFWAPMGIGALLYALSSLVGGEHDHGDAEGGMEGAGEPAGEIGHDADTDAPDSHEGVAPGGVENYFGVGRVPLAAILASLMFGWGVSGLVMNQIVGHRLILLSLCVAGGAAIGFTRFATRLLARYLPTYESYSQSGLALFLTEGEVLYTVSEQHGTVRIVDQFNHLRDLPCRVRPGEPALPKGTQATIEDYDERRQIYYVRARF